MSFFCYFVFGTLHSTRCLIYCWFTHLIGRSSPLNLHLVPKLHQFQIQCYSLYLRWVISMLADGTWTKLKKCFQRRFLSFQVVLITLMFVEVFLMGLVINDIEMGWDIMIGSWDWRPASWTHVSSGPWHHDSALAPNDATSVRWQHSYVRNFGFIFVREGKWRRTFHPSSTVYAQCMDAR